MQRFFPVMGITRVADITGLDTIGIPVIAVCRPNSRSVVVSLGKGLDVMAARASGVMESIEAFMAERIVRPLIIGSVNDLRFSHRLVDVDLIPRTADSLYHPDFPLLWVEGQGLISQSPVWVPYELVHTAYTLPAPTGTGCFIATSNGLASGNHLLEAISHGICETVERDAATLHALRTAEDRALRLVDPRTVDDAACREALDRLDRAGMVVAIWDMTTDIGIPAFRCMIAESDQHPARHARAVPSAWDAIRTGRSRCSGRSPRRRRPGWQCSTRFATSPITWAATTMQVQKNWPSRRPTSPSRRPATSHRFRLS